MTPIEHYWPPELLAAALPERYGHLMPCKGSGEALASARTPSRQAPEALEGGCRLYRLPLRPGAMSTEGEP